MGFLFFWSHCEEFIGKWAAAGMAGAEKSAKQARGRAFMASAESSCVVNRALWTGIAWVCSAKADGY